MTTYPVAVAEERTSCAGVDIHLYVIATVAFPLGSFRDRVLEDLFVHLDDVFEPERNDLPRLAYG